MTDIEQAITLLQLRLSASSSPDKKEWWENYMRGVIEFRGVGIPTIREELAIWLENERIAKWDKENQLNLALRLFESPIAEDKLAGILYLQDYLYDQFDGNALIGRYAELYTNRYIFDWNTCDWFCVRVLGPTIEKYGPACAKSISDWRSVEDLWQARSSVVAFVNLSDQTSYYPLILQSCEALIAREERFAKTAVGWVLREISRIDQDIVYQFVQEQQGKFSLEALRNALKYFDGGEKSQLIQQFKDFNQAKDD